MHLLVISQCPVYSMDFLSNYYTDSTLSRLFLEVLSIIQSTFVFRRPDFDWNSMLAWNCTLVNTNESGLSS